MNRTAHVHLALKTGSGAMLIALDERADAVPSAITRLGAIFNPHRWILSLRTIVGQASLPVTIAAILAVLLAMCGIASAASQPPRSMLVILLPGTTLSDWVNDPTLHKLMDQGAVGLMNTRTARMPSDKHREPPDAAVLTLAAGARAAAPATPIAFAPSIDPTWVDPDWPHVMAANRSLGYDVRLGNLADALRSAHVPLVAVRLLPQQTTSKADLLASNGMGILEAVDATAVPSLLRSGACAVVDLGGSDAQAGDRLPQIADLTLKSHARLLIVSPFVNDRAYADDDRLAPVLMLGDTVPHGLLYSPSTRHAGLITNTDIAPTIAAYFGATLPTPAFGRPVTYAASNDPVGDVHALRRAALRQRHGQRVLPYCAVVLGLCLILLSFVKPTGLLHRIGITLPFAILTALLVSPSLPFFSVECGIFCALLMTLSARKREYDAPYAASVGLAAVMLSNTICNNGVMVNSLLDYSPIEGARYYGIGNEVLGVLTGALLVLLSAWWPVLAAKPSRIGQWVITAVMIAVVAIVGWPSMGAKAGGVIVLTGAFLVFLMSSRGTQLTAVRIAAAAAIGIATLAALAIADSLHGSASRSHMGAAVDLIHHGGLTQALDIIVRKLAVELKLATHSTWALPVWAGLACLVQQRKRALASANQAAIALLDSTLVAAILMLIFNDAGAVACALCLSIVCSYAAATYGMVDKAATESGVGRPPTTEVMG